MSQNNTGFYQDLIRLFEKRVLMVFEYFITLRFIVNVKFIICNLKVIQAEI